jgi:hypothetical protein
VTHAYNPSYLGGRIRKIAVRIQPGQIVHKTLSWKKKPSQKRAGGVAQGVSPKFKHHSEKKKKTLRPFINQGNGKRNAILHLLDWQKLKV